jgi:hypothetical protein
MNQVVKGSTIDHQYGVFTLEGSRAYRVTAQLGWEATTPEYYQFGIFNVETNEQIGPLAEALPPNAKTSNASGGVLDVLIAPQTTAGFCLRMAENVSAPPTSVIRGDVSTFLNIVEVLPYGDFALGLYSDYTINKGTWSGREVDLIEKYFEPDPMEPEIPPCAPKIVLRAGVAYRITAQLGWKANTPEYYQFGLYDMQTGEQIGPLAEALSPNLNTCNASGGVLDVIHTPDKDRFCCIRMSDNMTAGPWSKIRSDVSTFTTVVNLTYSFH